MSKAPIAILALLVGSVAHAQRQPPSDIDLKSTYCIAVLNGRISSEEVVASLPGSDWITEGARAAQQRYRSEVQRLRAYVLPKTQYLDADALIVAAERGRADWLAYMRTESACLTRCEMKPPVTKDSIEKLGSCLSACRAEEPAFARAASCSPVNWLPF